jgi:hypothetical protein
MLSKLFLPPAQGAEREVVDKIIKKKQGENFSILKTRYFNLRTGRANWTTPNYACLPEALDCFPPYWVMPWRYKERARESFIQRQIRLFSFPKLYRSFCHLVDCILQEGFNTNCEAIKGDCLVHPDFGEVFIYTDGNQRMGILSLLAEQAGNPDYPVPVKIDSKVHRDDIMQHPAALEGIRKRYFSQADVLRWFDHPFQVLNSKKF